MGSWQEQQQTGLYYGLQIKRRPATDAYRPLLVVQGSVKRDQGPFTPGVTKIRRQRERERQNSK